MQLFVRSLTHSCMHANVTVFARPSFTPYSSVLSKTDLKIRNFVSRRNDFAQLAQHCANMVGASLLLVCRSVLLKIMAQEARTPIELPSQL